ncbi:MAG TPA: hypothetical protein VHD87_00500 [Acidimicrobiales bacterium]|nr:hypothetical protein [Acidimicrobiales bacterium]
MRRLAAVVLLLLTACASHVEPTTRFRGHGLAFTHPKAWAAWQFDQPMLVVYLSNQPLHEPCHDNSCADPIDTLPRNSVLVAWYEGPKGRVAKENLRVGGQPAHKTVWHNGCIGLHADCAVTVRFDDPSHTTTYTMNACLRGPSVAAERRAVDRILASLKFE